MSSSIPTLTETPAKEIQRLFYLQKENQFNVANTNAAQRIKKLNKIHKATMKYRPQIKEALFKDYKKHPSEVDLTEVYPVTSELKHAKKHLGKWVKMQPVDTPIALMGSSSYIKHEAKGVVLIIAPWNFPFNLMFGPLISAVAAGNTVILKPSEHTPHISTLMKQMIEEIFEKNEVAVVEGGIPTSQALLELPFNHIFFTGAPAIGKIVMRAAAKHLTSVTLELGGKSPTIIDETANINTAARRLAWGKCLNNGQVCIAPDYIYVHESKKQVFIDKFKEYVKQFYTENVEDQESYCRIVNQQHFQRVKSYMDDAVSKGAKIELGGQTNGSQDFISPTLMTNVPMDSTLMTEEIFGPILPVYGFTDVDEVLKAINAKEKPLALYIYSSSKKKTKYILNNTRAGNTCINHNAVNFFNTNLPFGGSNNSGIGKAHGRYGFEAFSNARAVLKQHIPNALELLMPPYTNFKQKLIDLTIKLF